MTMEPYQQRVIDEKSDLVEKIAKLETFVDGPQSDNVAYDERKRLAWQLAYMRLYSGVLEARIAAF